MEDRYSYSGYEPLPLSAFEGSSTCSDHVSSIGSSRSYKSRVTTNTSYSSPSGRKILEESREPEPREYVIDGDALSPAVSPARSSSSFSSSVSTEDSWDSEESFHQLEVEDAHTLEAMASTPRNFANYFPSANRVTICHDDSTLDGNMNLRLDTTIHSQSGERRQLTLFHLRMRDLKTRDFSLRRYCRDSGREVCHSKRRVQPLSEQGIKGYFSNALASLRWSKQPSADLPPPSTSWEEDDSDDEEEDVSGPSRTRLKLSNVMNLEFSNYTHIDVSPQGHGLRKCHTFEYWGLGYTWRQTIRQSGRFAEKSFHLFRNDEDEPLAHIVPFALTTAQARDEVKRGGWVPPCSLWIRDERIINHLPDVADVIVATGLMALVDESIKTRWPRSRRRAFTIPLSPVSLKKPDVEYLSPRRLIDEIFNRAQRPLLKSRRRTC